MATGTAVEVVMPQMGVSVSEGTITKWLKSEGEPIAADESLLEISTDKVDTEVPSPATGVLQQIFAQEGETVAVGTKIAVIAPEGAEAEAEAPPEPAPEPATQEAAAEVSQASSAEGETPTAEQGEGEVVRAAAAPEPEPSAEPEPPPAQPQPPAAAPQPPAPAPQPPAAAPQAPAGAPQAEDENGRREARFVSPVVARIAAEHNVDVASVQGTGRGGRVTKKDIMGYIESGQAAQAPAAPAETPAPAEPPEAAPAPAPAAPQAAPAPAPVTPQAAPAPAPVTPQAAPAPTPAAPEPPPAREAPPEQGETVEPMSAMRKGIAEHMRRSLDTSAHVTSAIEVDMTRIATLRRTLKKEWADSYGVNPTFLAFIARAVVDTLRDYPWVNGEIRGDSIVTRNYVNLGFAVELADGKGLIVPVVRNAESLNLLGMARAIADVAERARSKQLLPDDVQGGTFTITNPGGYGTFHGTPVISQPQAAILGTYAVVKRPWVVEDEDGQDAIAIRSMMNLTLTYDHRLVDGALAGRFLRDLRGRLQSWDESDE
jgi:2-oxoglutarate dehydrogenase E2 component (dihydrolipoamide succinyltransferase)